MDTSVSAIPPAGGSHLVWLVALAAGLSHSLQSAAADYFRNAWLYFAEGKSRAELDSSRTLRLEFDRLRWRTDPSKKISAQALSELHATTGMAVAAPG